MDEDKTIQQVSFTNKKGADENLENKFIERLEEDRSINLKINDYELTFSHEEDPYVDFACEWDSYAKAQGLDHYNATNISSLCSLIEREVKAKKSPIKD